MSVSPVISFLILLPVAAAFMLILSGNRIVRSIVTVASTTILAAGTALLFVINFYDPVEYCPLKIPSLDSIMFAIEVTLAAYIFYLSLRHRKHLVTALLTAQTSIMVFFRIRFGNAIPVSSNMFVDKLS
ncbi:MAG: hypothetical protein ABH885_02880, partial [Candidatus Omnitrophota bacterium]